MSRLALGILAMVAFSLLAGCSTPASTSSSSTGPAQASPLSGSDVTTSVAGVTFQSVRTNPSGFEPRIAVGHDGTRWVSTSDGGSETVYKSTNGLNWTRTADPQVVMANADNEVIVTPSGRVITASIAQGVTFDLHYSDDGGKTWTQSVWPPIQDEDREWLAAGPKDPITGDYDVYLLFHNLASGTADHEMMVATSRDNGATFGAPIPITLPGSQAWLDLQCADSGGPSNIFTNAATGQVYAVFGTRSSAVGGGCGASVTGPFEINIVAATRTWVATSKDQGTTWTDSLAVDDSADGKIVGMQVNAGTIDNQGNVYVVYPESPQAFPHYDGAAVKYVWAPGDLSHWSKPITVSPATDGTAGTGHLLTHIVAGDPGHVAVFSMTGTPDDKNLFWFPTVAETWDGLDAAPTFATTQVSLVPGWNGTAASLMGVCNPLGSEVPTAVNTALNGFACGRSSDVYGQALDMQCQPTFVWYDGSAAKDKAGTYVVTQTGGRSLCDAPMKMA